MQPIRHPARPVVALAAVLSFAAGVPADALAQREARDNEYAVNDPRIQHRSYVMEETGETIPYALFVPSGYDPATPAPLMVSLHGAGRQYDWLMNYAGFLDLAEHHGYVVVTPLGYTRRGGYGYRGDSEQDRRAEQDVMNVFGMVTEELNIDENRIYLWGHSMGGAGTYYIASRHPDIWAGLAPAHPVPGAPGLGGPDRPRRAGAGVGGEDARAGHAASLHRDPRRRPLALHFEEPRGGRTPVLVLRPRLEEDAGRAVARNRRQRLQIATLPILPAVCAATAAQTALAPEIVAGGSDCRPTTFALSPRAQTPRGRRPFVAAQSGSRRAGRSRPPWWRVSPVTRSSSTRNVIRASTT